MKMNLASHVSFSPLYDNAFPVSFKNTVSRVGSREWIVAIRFSLIHCLIFPAFSAV